MSEERPIKDIDEVAETRGRPGISVGVVLAAVALALFVVFIFQNLESSEISFLGFDVVLPQWLSALIVFLLGVIVGYFGKARRERRKRKALSP